MDAIAPVRALGPRVLGACAHPSCASYPHVPAALSQMLTRLPLPGLQLSWDSIQESLRFKGTSRILIDTGQGIDGYEQLLLSTLQLAHVDSLSHVLCTHRHHDHVGGIPQVLRVVGALGQNPASVKIHKWIDGSSDSNRLLGQARDNDTASATTPESDLASVAATHNQFAAFEPIHDNQIFETEGAKLTALYTPGHTSDHVAFFLNQERAIFTGDCVLGQGSAVFERLSQLMSSLQRMLAMLPTRIYPGHGPVVESGMAKIQEYLDHRLDRERQILRLLDKPTRSGWTPADLAREIYVGYPKDILPAAQRSVLHHLEKLADDGVAERVPLQNGDGGEWRLCVAAGSSFKSS